MITLAHPVAPRPLVLRLSVAGELMRPNPCTLDKDLPIAHAAELLAGRELDVAPVIDSRGRLVGEVTAAACNAGRLSAAVVGDIANPDVECVTEGTLTRELIDGFVQRQSPHIYVLDADDELVGVVTMVDVLRRLTSNFSPI